MDGRRFDEFAKALACGTSRRTILKTLVASAGGVLAGPFRARRGVARQPRPRTIEDPLGKPSCDDEEGTYQDAYDLRVLVDNLGKAVVVEGGKPAGPLACPSTFVVYASARDPVVTRCNDFVNTINNGACQDAANAAAKEAAAITCAEGCERGVTEVWRCRNCLEQGFQDLGNCYVQLQIRCTPKEPIAEEEPPAIVTALLDLSPFIPLPSEVGPDFGITGGTMVVAPEGLAELGYGPDLPDLIAAIAPEFRGAYQVFYTTPPGPDGVADTSVGLLAVGFATAQGAEAGIEVFFGARPADAVDETRGDEGDKGYTIQFPFQLGDGSGATGIVVESGAFLADAARVVVTRTAFSGDAVATTDPAARAQLASVYAAASRQRLMILRQPDGRPPGAAFLFGSLPAVSWRPLALVNEVLPQPGETQEQVALRDTEFAGAESALGVSYLFGGDRYRLGNRIVVYRNPADGQFAIANYPDYFADLIASQGLTGERTDLPIVFGDQAAFYRFVIATDDGVVPGLTMAGLFTDLPGASVPPALLVTVSLRDQEAVAKDDEAAIRAAQEALGDALNRIAGPYDALIRSFPYGDVAQVFVLDVDGVPPAEGTVGDTSHQIECPEDLTVPNGPGTCEAVLGDPGGATSNLGLACEGADGPISIFPVGTTTLYCTDAAGQGCTFDVTVEDAEKPTIGCPVDVTEQAAAGACSAEVLFEPQVQDNCPGVEFACDPASGSAFPVGATEVVCTAQDRGGNVASCRFTVTVEGAGNCAAGGEGATTEDGDADAGGQPRFNAAPDFAYNSALWAELGSDHGYLQVVGGTFPQLEAIGFADLAPVVFSGAQIENASVVRFARPVTPGLTTTGSFGLGAGFEVVSLLATPQDIDLVLPILQTFPFFGQVVEGSVAGIPDEVDVTYGALEGGAVVSALSRLGGTALLITVYNFEGGQSELTDARRLTRVWWRRNRDVTEQGQPTIGRQVARIEGTAEEAYFALNGAFAPLLDEAATPSDLLKRERSLPIGYRNALVENLDRWPDVTLYGLLQRTPEGVTIGTAAAGFADGEAAADFRIALPAFLTANAQELGQTLDVEETSEGDTAFVGTDVDGLPFFALARQFDNRVVAVQFALTIAGQFDGVACREEFRENAERLLDGFDRDLSIEFSGVGSCFQF